MKPGGSLTRLGGERWMPGGIRFVVLLWLVLLSACNSSESVAPGEPAPAPEPVYRPQIVDSRPHDPQAFTQGLIFQGNVWLESTGGYGESDLREVDMATGRVLRSVALEPRFFGEGLDQVGERLFQLTWRERTCLVYDRERFVEVQRFRYPGEGWGLTSDGERLYMSDGSAVIRVLDPENFEEVRRLQVRGVRGPVQRLNELEWVAGEIWANVFQSGWLVRISPQDGRVLGFVDLHELPPAEDRHSDQDVLNGIAYDPATDRIWVTGKRWKYLYAFDRHPLD